MTVRTPTPLQRNLLTAIVLSLGSIACGSSDDSSATPANPTSTSPDDATDDSVGSDTTVQATDGTEPMTSGELDITGRILAKNDSTCDAYVGEYTSMVTDVSTDTAFEGSFTVSASDGSCSFVSNQIPNHDVGDGSRFATDVAEVDLNITITANPELEDEPSDLDMGASIVMLNGVKWEAYPAACFGVGNEPAGKEAIGCFEDQIDNPWRYNIGSPLNEFGFDDYFAHVQPNGLYHYHSTPVVLYDIDCAGTETSPVIGFASDGFPVHGPCFTDADGTIRKAESSFVVKEGARQDVDNYTTPYVTGNVASDQYDGQFVGDYEWSDGAGDLDECNGMTVDGQYGYYVTGDFPYVLRCYSGTPSTRFR